MLILEEECKAIKWWSEMSDTAVLRRLSKERSPSELTSELDGLDLGVMKEDSGVWLVCRELA